VAWGDVAAIKDILCDLASSDDGEDVEEEDDEPGWVMGTITKMVQQRIKRSRQKQMMIAKLTQPGWEDAADYFREQDM